MILGRDFKGFFKSIPVLKRLLISITILVTVIATSVGGFVYANTKTVNVYDGDAQIVVSTMKVTVAEFLAERGVTIDTGDEVVPPLNASIKKGDIIKIKRAVDATIEVDGKVDYYRTAASTVAEFLSSQNITLGEADELNVLPTDRVSQKMHIAISRVVGDVVRTTESIAFKKQTKQDSSLKKGDTKVGTYGQDGVLEKTFKVVLKDGAEISRELVSEDVKKQPTDEVILVGTKEDAPAAVKASTPVAKTASIPTVKAVVGDGFITTSRGEEVRYTKTLSMVATAYTAEESSYGTRTATGMTARVGVVAVDPKVIPLHSKLYIASPDGSYSYGIAVAGDTGGAIKGNKIDLYFDTLKECNNFGRRTMTVYVLE